MSCSILVPMLTDLVEHGEIKFESSTVRAVYGGWIGRGETREEALADLRRQLVEDIIKYGKEER